MTERNWETRLMEAVLRHRIVLLVGIGVLTAGAGYFASRVTFDSSIEVWFLEDDPDLVAYQDFLDRFEADEITVMGVFADDVFTPAVLASLRRMTDAAELAPHVHRARSLTNVRIATGSEGTIDIAPLVDALPGTREEAQTLRRVALGNRLLVGSLVAEDGKAAAIVVEMEPSGQDFESKVEMVRALTEIAEREAEHADVRLAGAAPFDDAFYRYTVRDFSTFAPVSLAVVALCILVVFRRLSAVLVPVAVVGLSLTWLYGLMGLCGCRIDVVSTALPAVILAVGVADTLHVLADNFRELAAGRNRHDAVRHSIAGLLVPCFVTSATTAGGMLSLLVSDLRPVQQFGALAAAGVILAFAFSVTVAPILLCWLKPPGAGYLSRLGLDPVGRAMGWLAGTSRLRAWVVVALSIIIVGLAAWQVTTLEVGANAMDYFRPGDPIRTDTLLLDERLGGTASVELVVHTKEEGLKEPAILERLDRLERWAEGLPGVTKTLSVVDQLKEMNRILDGRHAFELPDRRDKTAQLYLLLEGEEDFDAAVQDNYSVGRITARVQMSRAQELAHQVPLLERELEAKYHDGDLRVDATGYVKLMSDMEIYLLESQTRSLLIAFTVIVIIIGILLRSARLALFSMIPNFAPILAGVGFMALAGISLNPGTVMIGSIALGLVVDDTVHFVVRLRRQIRAGNSLEGAIRASVQIAGRPIIVTSLALIAGFLVLTLGSFTPNVDFGIVTAVVIFLALAADLMVLPAALVLVRPRL